MKFKELSSFKFQERIFTAPKDMGQLNLKRGHKSFDTEFDTQTGSVYMISDSSRQEQTWVRTVPRSEDEEELFVTDEGAEYGHGGFPVYALTTAELTYFNHSRGRDWTCWYYNILSDFEVTIKDYLMSLKKEDKERVMTARDTHEFKTVKHGDTFYHIPVKSNPIVYEYDEEVYDYTEKDFTPKKGKNKGQTRKIRIKDNNSKHIVHRRKEHRLRWIDKKYFFLSDGKNRAYFRDLMNFMKTEEDDKQVGLDYLHQKYCGKWICEKDGEVPPEVKEEYFCKLCSLSTDEKAPSRCLCGKASEPRARKRCICGDLILNNGSKEFYGVDVDMGRPELLKIETILKRNQVDAIFTNDLVKVMFDALAKFMPKGIPERLYSPASLAEYLLITEVDHQYLKPFRQGNPIHAGMLEYATRAFYGGIFDEYAKGKLEDCDEDDISSCYPDKIQYLEAMTPEQGEIIFVRNSNGLNNPRSVYQIYHVYQQLDLSIPVRLNEGLSVYCASQDYEISPYGDKIYPYPTDMYYERWITGIELRKLISRGVDVAVIDGYEFIRHDGLKPIYPFFEIVDRLYKLKDSLDKNDPLRLLVKETLNSNYGKFCQSVHGIGFLYNPVYASWITAGGRIQLFDKKLYWEENGGRVDALATDAVKGKRPPNDLEEPKGLGHFERKQEVPRIQIQTHNGVIFDKNQKMIRRRGYRVIDPENMKFKEDRIVFKFHKTGRLRQKYRENKLQDVGKDKVETKELVYFDSKKQWNKEELTTDNLWSKRIQAVPWDDIGLQSLGETGYTLEEVTAKGAKSILYSQLSKKQTLESRN